MQNQNAAFKNTLSSSVFSTIPYPKKSKLSNKMADLRDEFGNPVKLTDEIGNPVQLTDERGNPVHITGVATAVGGAGGGTLKDIFKKDEPVDFIKKGETAAAVSDVRRPAEKIDSGERREGKLDRSSSTSSSSSSSEEDDGMGGRRKKGLKDKLREKLNLGKDKEQETATTVTGVPAATATPFPAVPAAKVTTHPAEPLHEKKSMLEKIKEKLPGHHGHGH